MGFFFADKKAQAVRSASDPAQSKQATKQLSLLSPDSLNCNNCSLNKAVLQHPKMLPTGAKKPVVYILGEAPGADEDEEGEQFVGRAGQTLRERIPKEWEPRIRWNNTIRCFISPKVMVHTVTGQKQIKDVQVGELVLTHTGKFKKVISRIHDLPPRSRMYTGDLYQVRIKFTDSKGKGVLQTVIKGHKFLTEGRQWEKVENLRNGDRVQVLAQHCNFCGRAVFKHHSMPEELRCSPKCYQHSEELKQKFSSDMKQQYLSGARDRFEITREANKKTRKLAKSGKLSLQNLDIKTRWRATKKKPAPKGVCIGYGETRLFKALEAAKLKPIHQFKIVDEVSQRIFWVDIGLPEHKILIELDGQSHKNKPVRLRDEKLDSLTAANGWTMLRFSSQERTSKIIASVERLLRNHNNEYEFISAEIQVSSHKTKRPTPLYCLEVEEDSSFLVNNVVHHNCRPPGNRDPSQLELACCRRLQEDDIAKSGPFAVFGFGNIPLEWMTGQRGIHQWRGRRIPCKIKEHSFWFYPMLHPSYINRIRNDKKKGKEWEQVFTLDLARAFKDVEREETPFVEDYKKDLLKGIIPLLSWKVDDVVNAFVDILEHHPDEIGLDIETNGLKPQAKGAKILSIAFGTYDKTYSLPLDHRQSKWNKEQRKEIDGFLREFLLDSVRKWCHNVKFEQEWLSYFYRNDILFESRWGDTMAQAHVLDEREGKALEDVTMENLGFNLKKCHTVDVKHLDNELLEDVLWYNGTDTKYTHACALLQRERLEAAGLPEVYEMTNRRAPALVLTQRRGLYVDQKEVGSWNKKLSGDIAKTEEKIASLPDVIEWERVEGMKFSPSSTHNLSSLLRDHLKIKEGRTESGGYTTDETVLEKIKHPIGKLMLAYRADTTLHTRYVTPYLPGGKHIFPDGKVYGNFSHLVTRTGRLASDDPNLQNFPKKKRRELRNIIYAPEGYWLVPFDYGQIEARVIGMASKDAKFCEQLWTAFDIHAHWANRLFEEYPEWRDWLIKEFELNKKDEKLIFKTGRQEMKNQWVFPQFFGSRYEACAAGLNIPQSIARDLSDEFWSDYSGAKGWQEQLHDFYWKNGYVETLTNRRRRAPLSVNERVNSPIQGTASDIVVDAMERLSVIAYEQDRPQLQPVLNVHDDLTFLLPEKTLEEDAELIAHEMIMCRYSFINVPVVVEMSIGRAWGSVEEVQVFRSNEYDDWNKLFGHHHKLKAAA